MAEYKSTFKLRSTEDIFVSLEENTVTLSTMKASKYFVVFEKDIAYWERTLSHISETIEIILQARAAAGLRETSAAHAWLLWLARGAWRQRDVG
jgi:hypothetical protein